MHAKTVLLLLTASALTLTACGGGGSGTADGVDYTSASSIAQALDKGGFACTGWTPNTQVVGAREDGTCDHTADQSVSVTTFESADQMKTINEATSSLASGVYVRGDKWQVNVADADQASQVQKIIGGDVK